MITHIRAASHSSSSLVQARIDYKLSTICHSFFSGLSPAYFSDFLTVYTPSNHLRSFCRHMITSYFSKRHHNSGFGEVQDDPKPHQNSGFGEVQDDPKPHHNSGFAEVQDDPKPHHNSGFGEVQDDPNLIKTQASVKCKMTPNFIKTQARGQNKMTQTPFKRWL